jgi:S1-C subfamily serine protease
MTNEPATILSTALADAVERTAPGVVQVQGRRRPASGLVYQPEIVLTMMRAIGSEDGLHVRRHDGEAFEAHLGGWDPTTSLALLRVPGLGGHALTPTESLPRVGHLSLAIARSWSNSVTASAGIDSVIAGPLPTGRRRAIEQVIRTSAPMHEGFAGGAFADTSGGLIGVTTAIAIRGLGVVIPASIAWKTAAHLAEHGGLKRGYLGIAGQTAQLSAAQRALAGRDEGLLIVSVTGGSPADGAGILVGDVLMAFEGQAIDSPDRLLDSLRALEPGQRATCRILRAAALVDATIVVGERPTR